MIDKHGLGTSLSSLSRLSEAKSRSISPENMTGGSGAGGKATVGTGSSPSRDLGQGWKVSPSIEIAKGATCELASIEHAGAIQQMWITALDNVRLRDLILRAYWDDQPHPSVEVPLGDFFCHGTNGFTAISSLPVCVNPGRAFNCFWEMPFRKSARLTLENRSRHETATIYYQINYVESEIPDDCAYFHAQFRRSNPLPYKECHTIIDDVEGHGHYVGTYMTWGVKSAGWWGEGEVKFFLDDDRDYPTICGTGTEDYFLGSHNFDVGSAVRGFPKAYTGYSTAYAGFVALQTPDGVYSSQQIFGLYRWHIVDPIRFDEKLKVTIQALGWRDHDGEGSNVDIRRYLPLQDDIASVAFWYQTLPSKRFPDLPDRDALEIN